MDRKALIFIIIILCSLVLLMIVHFNEQAMAPIPSATINAVADLPRPTAALIDLTDNSNSQNATITPMPTTSVKYNHIQAQRSTATPVPSTSPLPTAVAPMTPWKPMDPWKPMGAMTPAIPMGAMTPMLPG